MKPDKTILENIEKKNPFTVPEGYFNNLTAQIMDSLPEKREEKRTSPTNLKVWKKISPWVYMAAMICGMTFGIRFFIEYNTPRMDSTTTAHKNAETVSLSEEDILVSSVSDYELYEYLYETGDNF